jgi:hypothetical protein
MSTAMKTIIIILAIIGLIAVLAVLGMGLMHASMMGSGTGMMQRMASMCQGMMANR